MTCARITVTHACTCNAHAYVTGMRGTGARPVTEYEAAVAAADLSELMRGPQAGPLDAWAMCASPLCVCLVPLICMAVHIVRAERQPPTGTGRCGVGGGGLAKYADRALKSTSHPLFEPSSCSLVPQGTNKETHARFENISLQRFP